jgi:FkbM family methyltransferase
MGLTKNLTRRVLPRQARNWLRSPRQSLRWAWCDLQAKGGWLTTVELRDGWRFRSHPAALPFAYHAQIDDPEQRSEFDGFVSRCTPGMRLFDLGSHFGLFSLAALHYGGAKAEAVAVDPSPLAIRMVAFQAEANGVAARLRTKWAAAGDAPGTMALVAAGIESAGYFVPPTGDHPSAEQTTVPMVSVDSLAEEFGPPTHLKIDVEGAEGGVLDGAAATLRGFNPPVVFLELHNDILKSRNEDPLDVLGRLNDAGYRLLDVSDRLVDPVTIRRPPVVRLVGEPSR